jgi:anti-sigma regulatory factor (Ser/Thr protein kinase)
VVGISRSEFDPRSWATSGEDNSGAGREQAVSHDAHTALYLSESYPALPRSVPRARKLVTELAAEAGVRGQRLEDIRLVVSEAVTNAVSYAYKGPAGEIQVLAAVVSGELWIVIADDGEGMRGRGGDARGLGLGLGLMARLSDALTILTRSSGGVEVRMRFDLPGQD